MVSSMLWHFEMDHCDFVFVSQCWRTTPVSFRSENRCRLNFISFSVIKSTITFKIYENCTNNFFLSKIYLKHASIKKHQHVSWFEKSNLCHFIWQEWEWAMKQKRTHANTYRFQNKSVYEQWAMSFYKFFTNDSNESGMKCMDSNMSWQIKTTKIHSLRKCL